MRAGRLNRRITIQVNSSSTTNGYGEKIKQWTDLFTVWADKRDLSAKELFTAGQIYPEVATAFILRYSSSVNAMNRVSYGGKIYNIRSVIDPRDEQRELQLLCTAGATA
jgi:SPP1 family predicted phage head-tail adaptor